MKGIQNITLKILVIVNCLMNVIPVVSQVTADFTLKTPICKYEDENLVNTSINATSYQWDFSFGDLDSIVVNPANSLSIPVDPGGFPIDIEVEYDKGVWFGFAVDFLTNKMYRLEYGTSLTNSPVVVDLGNPNGVLSFPSQSKFYMHNNIWYGFVTNYVGNKLVRLTFANGLAQAPTAAENLGDFSSLHAPMSLEILNSSGDYTIIVSNSTSNNLSLIHFGNSLANNPSSSDVIEAGGAVGFNSIGRISVKNYGGEWVGLVFSVNDSKVYRMKLGSVVFDNTNDFDLVGSITNPEGVEFIEEGGKYFGFVANRGAGIYKIDFGNNAMGGGTIGSLGNFGITDEFRSLKLVRDTPGWKFFTFSRNGAILSRINIDDRGVGQPWAPSTSFEPSGIHFKKSGGYKVELTAVASNGLRSVLSKTVTVLNSRAPDIAIYTLNQCLSNINNFSVSTDATDIATYSWDFNNDEVEDSNSSSPNYQFSSAGDYTISLSASNVNGCEKSVQRNLKIYSPPPTPVFSISSQPLCTNSNFTFTNQTNENGYDNLLTYEWRVDGNQISTNRDLITSFSAIKNYSIGLRSLLTGCTNEAIQTVNITQVGANVDFLVSGQCEVDQVTFTNTSSGSIASYSWDFGNGNTSTLISPAQTFNSKGIYQVSLQTISTNGCVSSLSKNITIYSKPQPNFSLDLPPFSCSGTPSQLNDLTPGPTDSNLASWAWSFGDAGTSTDRNPLHTFTNAGDYNVSLTATTNFGCSGSFQKSVTIAASPTANFNYTPACINQGTRFTDASGAGVKSWLWTIGGSTYAFSNPTHVFSGAGNYTAKLTVTGDNSCVATVTKTINVPVAPSLNFSVDNACEKQASSFKDISPVNTDPSASWSWDFAGQGTATGNSAQYSFASAGIYAVKMTSTQQSGCVYSLSKNVTINTTPVAAFTSSPEWGVPPLSVQFTNASTGASSYSWHFNDRNNSTSAQASPAFQFTELGDYVVDLLATSALGCSSTTSGKISVIIPSLDLELKQLQLVKDPASNVYRIFVTVKNKSNYLLTSVDVVVDISGSALIKETINTSLAPDAEIVQLLNNQILPRNSLTYLCASVEVDNDNDPFNNSKCESIEEETVVFAPYPNPSNGAFRFEWISPAADKAHFEIFNSMGQLVFEQNADTVQVGLNQVQFDLSSLNTGAYYFRFTSNGVSKTLPIQIVR